MAWIFAALIFGAAAAWAQDSTPVKCQAPPPLRPSPSLRETKLVCGSNTITQNVSLPALPASAIAIDRVASGKPPSDSGFLTALIAGAAGVFGALAGALASYLTVREKARSDLELETKRLYANMIAAERLRWLQDIRFRLCAFYKTLDLQYNMLKRPATTQQALTQQQLDDMSSEAMAECNMITLMLNPAKPDQATVRDAIQGALRVMQDAYVKRFDDAQYAARKHQAFDAMTRLGVETWRQVKTLR